MPSKRKSRLTLGRKYARKNKRRPMGATRSMNCDTPVLISEADPALTSLEEYHQPSIDTKGTIFLQL